MAEEPTLPPLLAVSWNEGTQSFSNNPRKRGRVRRSSNAGPLFNNSSDPAIFSSDDDPALDNYVEGRRKRRYVGSWFHQQPVSESSSFEVEESRPLPKPKRTLRRQLDSGVWMGSDGTDVDEMMEEFLVPPQPKLPQLQRPVIQRPMISAAERLARDRIQACLEEGNEDVELSSIGLESLSNETIRPLAELSCIPVVAEGVPFEHKDPSLRLFLSGNPLGKIPGGIFDLPNLTLLSLRSCGLKQLPPAVGKLQRLETLNLAQNHLRYLPAELLDIIAAPGTLKDLFMQGNSFCQPSRLPRQVAQGDSQLEPDDGHDGHDGHDAETVPTLATCDAYGVHEQALLRNLPATFEGMAARFMTRSPVEYTDSAGNVLSHFRLDTRTSDPVQTEASNSDSTPDLDLAGGDVAFRRNATRVPTLFELAARSCYRSPDLEELEHYIPESLPRIRAVLDRAVEQRSVGGYECWRCKKTLVTPETRWVEWWQVARVKRQAAAAAAADGSGSTVQFSPWSEIAEEQCVPFVRMGCSWKCVPGKMKPGQWMIREGGET